MLENDETLTKNTIIGQANIISELTEQLRDTQIELKEIKNIRSDTERKNWILSNALQDIRLLSKHCDNKLVNKIKSILDEATKQL